MVAFAEPEALRIVHWDRLRVLCFLDIATLHVTERHGLFGLGLPTFLLLSLCLSVRRRVPLDTPTFIERRVQRLLVPWVVWWIVFAALDTIHAARHGEALFSWFDPWMLVYGLKTHLWFMPFIAAAGLLIHGLDKLTQRVPGGVLVSACMAAALVGLMITDLELSKDEPFVQWLFAIPAVPLALGLGRTLARATDRGAARRGLGLYLGAGVLTAFLAIVLRPGLSHVAVYRYVAGLGSLLVLVMLPQWADPITPMLQELMLGAYVLHPVIDEQLVSRLVRLYTPGVPGWLHVGAVVTLTLATVATMRRVPLLRMVC